MGFLQHKIGLSNKKWLNKKYFHKYTLPTYDNTKLLD